MKWSRWLLAAWLAFIPALVPAKAANPTPDAALELVQETTRQVLDELEANKETFEQEPARIFDLVERLVLPHFDFSRMSQWVLGRYWRTATAEQREQFTQQFKTLLVRTYATALLEYSNQTIEYQPVRAADDARTVTVRTEIQQSGGAPIGLNYSLFNNGSRWMVYDINVDGVSLVTNYRAEFSSRVRQQGMEALIAYLQSKNEKAREGGAQSG